MSKAQREAEHYYTLGLITAFERDEMIWGNCVINEENQLVWARNPFMMEIMKFMNPPEPRYLTPERMLEIQAHQLLGIGKGETTTPQNQE